MGEGEGGKDGSSSFWDAFRRLIVTMLDDGSVIGSHNGLRGSGVFRMAGSGRAFAAVWRVETTGSVPRMMELADSLMGFTVSTEVVGEPETEVRCRFRDATSLSSKGFGRVELGSAETARSERSGDSRVGSIGRMCEDRGRIGTRMRGSRARSVKMQRRHAVARDAPTRAVQN